MFSGIVEQTGRITRILEQEGGRRLSVSAPPIARGATRGDSIAVDGVCLTVAGVRQGVLTFDVVPETLRCTVLGSARAVGDEVNLERSLKVGDRISGHFVMGHVDGVGTVDSVEAQGRDVRLCIRLPQTIDPRAVAPKGSIAVNGVSLTVGRVENGWFDVYLIPETLQRTTLQACRTGDGVNLEIDVIGRYVQTWCADVSRSGSTITKEFLREQGFA